MIVINIVISKSSQKPSYSEQQKYTKLKKDVASIS